mgnify:CR=1 FL=1
MAEPYWVALQHCQEKTIEEINSQQVSVFNLFTVYRVELIKSVTDILKELTEDDIRDMWCQCMRKYI